MAAAEDQSTIWAILIGINHYIPGDKRGVRYRDLSGCVSDVGAIREYLQGAAGFRSTNITMLTSTKGGTNEGPLENAASLPVFENIVRELDNVTENARPGDLVYIHYSGHGISRSTNDLLDSEEDEGDGVTGTALALADVMTGGAYLTGYHLGVYVKRMVQQRGLRVTLVLDSCFSGGGLRDFEPDDGTTAVRTGDEGFDDEVLESDLEAENIVSQIDTDEDDDPDSEYRNATRVRSKSWLSDPKGCTVLTACDTDETAGEGLFEGKTYGKLTYWTLKLLSQSSLSGQRPSYAKLRKYAERNIEIGTGQLRRRQSPLLMGDVDYVFLGKEQVVEWPVSYVAKRTDNNLELDVGWAQGASKGAIYDIFPETANIRPQSVPSFKAEITETPRATPFRSKAILKPVNSGTDLSLPSSEDIGKGSSIVLRQWGLPDNVLVGVSKNIPQSSLKLLKTELEATPGLLLDIDAELTQEHDYELILDQEENHFVIMEDGEPVPRIPKVSYVPGQDCEWISKVSYLISHLARYRELEAIQVPCTCCTMTPDWFSYKVELEGEGEGNSNVQACREDQDGEEVPSGTVLLFTFELTEKCRIPCVYVSFYNLDASWGVRKVYPSYGHAFLAVKKDAPREFRLQMSVPPKCNADDPDCVTDIIRVFISTSKTCWEEITLPGIPADESQLPPDVLMVPTEVVDTEDGDDDYVDPGNRTANLPRSKVRKQLRPAKRDNWAVLDLKIRTSNCI